MKDKINAEPTTENFAAADRASRRLTGAEAAAAGVDGSAAAVEGADRTGAIVGDLTGTSPTNPPHPATDPLLHLPRNSRN